MPYPLHRVEGTARRSLPVRHELERSVQGAIQGALISYETFVLIPSLRIESAPGCRRIYSRITKFGLLVQRDVRRRKWRTTRHELVYFCSEHIENAEASRARVRLLVHDINSELHALAVDVHSFDRAAFRDAIKVVRECSSCVISARQLHMPRRFDGHRLPPGSRSAVPLSHPVWHTISDG
jgi:hypothetical protein